MPIGLESMVTHLYTPVCRTSGCDTHRKNKTKQRVKTMDTDLERHITKESNCLSTFHFGPELTGFVPTGHFISTLYPSNISDK